MEDDSSNLLLNICFKKNDHDKTGTTSTAIARRQRRIAYEKNRAEKLNHWREIREKRNAFIAARNAKLNRNVESKPSRNATSKPDSGTNHETATETPNPRPKLKRKDKPPVEDNIFVKSILRGSFETSRVLPSEKQLFFPKFSLENSHRFGGSNYNGKAKKRHREPSRENGRSDISLNICTSKISKNIEENNPPATEGDGGKFMTFVKKGKKDVQNVKTPSSGSFFRKSKRTRENGNASNVSFDTNAKKQHIVDFSDDVITEKRTNKLEDISSRDVPDSTKESKRKEKKTKRMKMKNDSKVKSLGEQSIDEDISEVQSDKLMGGVSSKKSATTENSREKNVETVNKPKKSKKPKVVELDSEDVSEPVSKSNISAYNEDSPEESRPKKRKSGNKHSSSDSSVVHNPERNVDNVETTAVQDGAERSGKRKKNRSENVASPHIRFAESDAAEGGKESGGGKVGAGGKARKRRGAREREDGDREASGRYTTLFGNNPEIPSIPRRAVRPVRESIFSNKRFEDMPIHRFLVSRLKELGMERATTVQRLATPRLLAGHDALVRSQTGSGKTLAYALALLELLQRRRPPLTRADGVRALVLLPTRELALQTYTCFLQLVKPFMRLVPGILVGGEKRKSEKARLRKGVTILVGTPCRVLDHVKNTCSLRLDKVQFLVIDEADRLHDQEFEENIARIVAALHSQSKDLPSEDVLDRNRSIENDSKGEEGSQTRRGNKKHKYISEESDSEVFSVVPQQKVELQPFAKEDVDELSDYDPEELAPRIVSVLPETKEIVDSSEEEGDEEEEEEEGDEAEEDEDGEGGSERGGEGDPERRWQTILLSATLTPAVRRLAGLALRSPVFVDAADDAGDAPGASRAAPVPAAQGDVVSIPDTLEQSFMVVPAKLRLVALSAFIIWKCKFTDKKKMLLFCATQDMVDYFTELLTVALSPKDTDENYSSDDEDAENCFNIHVDFFRLHGNMDQQERTHVFQTFSAAESGVLVCTDVAARGLDLPHVDWIVQWTAPAGVADYVHRVGRSARAGARGAALLFLLPSEAAFVEMLQDRRIHLAEQPLRDCLDKLTDASRHRVMERAATELQLVYERAVLRRESLHDSALKAYLSFVGFYASYPKDLRDVVSFKALHLGHLAKSFALRDSPKAIANMRRGQYFKQSGKARKAHGDRRWSKGGRRDTFAESHSSTRRLVVSEFSSGLEALPVNARP